MSYLLLLNELLTCSIFQNSWILMALVLNSALQLETWSITLDSTLSLHQQVINVCRVAYLELRRINSIRNLLSVDAVKTLVCSLVLSRLDYCNSLLVFLSILLRGFKEFKMQQPDQYLEHPDLSTSHHFSRTFTGCVSIGESCTRLLHYVILHYLALSSILVWLYSSLHPC